MSNYSLSFTGSALRKAESILLARCFLDVKDWQSVRKSAIEDNLLMIDSPSSRKRIAAELIKRLRNLTTEELDYLAETIPSEQSLLLWVAVCRTYQLAEDFSREVITHRFRGLCATITPGSIESFFDEQAVIHPELRSLSEQTRVRLRNQFLQMVKEAGLIDDKNQVQQVFLPQRLEALLKTAARDEAALFPTVR